MQLCTEEKRVSCHHFFTPTFMNIWNRYTNSSGEYRWESQFLSWHCAETVLGAVMLVHSSDAKKNNNTHTHEFHIP